MDKYILVYPGTWISAYRCVRGLGWVHIGVSGDYRQNCWTVTGFISNMVWKWPDDLTQEVTLSKSENGAHFRKSLSGKIFSLMKSHSRKDRAGVLSGSVYSFFVFQKIFWNNYYMQIFRAMTLLMSLMDTGHISLSSGRKKYILLAFRGCKI